MSLREHRRRRRARREALAGGFFIAALLGVGPMGTVWSAPKSSHISPEVLLAEEDPAVAEAAVNAFVEHKKGDPHADHLLGYLRFLEGKYAQAKRLLDSAAARRPNLASYRHLANLVSATAEATAGFLERRSAHFVVAYPPGGPEALLAPYALETLEAAYVALGRDLGYSPSKPVRVEIYASPSALSRVSSLSQKEIETSGVVGVCKWNRILVVSPAALARGYPWLDTLAHEYTHFVVSRLSRNRAPVWLQEGIAKLEEQRWRNNAPAPPSPVLLQLLEEAIAKNRLISFSRMYPSVAKLPSQKEAALAFAEAQMAVYYLHERHGFAGLRALLATWAPTGQDRSDDESEEGERKRTRGPNDLEASIAKLERSSYRQWEAAWKRFAKRKVAANRKRVFVRGLTFAPPPGPGGKRPTKPPGPDHVDLPMDGTAQKFARLGGLLRSRGKVEAALIEYKKSAASLGVPDPLLENTLARLEVEVGRTPSAATRLAAALSLYPDVASLHLTAAHLALGASDGAAAEKELLAALRIHPMDPRVHCGLATVWKDELRHKRAADACTELGGHEGMLP